MRRVRRSRAMRVLVFGAGALGTLFAARLAHAGHDVALLARGARFEALRARGVRVREQGQHAARGARVAIVERVGDAPHDVIVVLVRRHQVDAALATIAAARGDRCDVLVMVNVATGHDPWRAALGPRLVVGFAGAVASFDADGTLAYRLSPAAIQPTVLGEPDGSSSPRVAALARAFEGAGFPVRVRDDLEHWQACHAAWMAPFMLAAGATGGDASRIREPELVDTWMHATREALELVKAARGRLVPAGLELVARLPLGLLATVVRAAFLPPTVRAELVATGLDSRSEGLALADELLAMARARGTELPALDELRRRAAG